jgi:oxidase EvaA
MTNNNYSNELNQFKEYFSSKLNKEEQETIEFKFERIFSTSTHEDYVKILSWYKYQVSQCSMGVKFIPLSECKEWSIDKSTGSLMHSSGEFFRVDGIRVSNSTTREVTGGWDQPILTQVGFDGGILGLIRKRINDIPHYLVEAKAEPGNFNLVQISTTVQATFSNLKKAHLGNQTPYSEYFLEPEKYDVKVILDTWMSEDGGRLLNKRNRSMIVEIAEDFELPVYSDRYRWVTLYQLVKLINKENAIVAPHIRGILSGV